MDEDVLSIMEQILYMHHEHGEVPEELWDHLEFMMWARYQTRDH